VRVRFNGRGTSVTAVEVVNSASGTAGALAGDDYYFLSANSAETGLTFRRLPAKSP
jgi:hypothetical protein